MATDFAIDPASGDFIFTAGRDLMLITGYEQIAQRIRTRLRVPIGNYVSDSNVEIGSDLHSLVRRYPSQVTEEIPAMVEESLAQMEDIDVLGIEIKFSEDSRVVTAVINFQPVILEEDVFTPLDEIPEL